MVKTKTLGEEPSFGALVIAYTYHDQYQQDKDLPAVSRLCSICQWHGHEKQAPFLPYSMSPTDEFGSCGAERHSLLSREKYYQPPPREIPSASLQRASPCLYL